MAGELPSLFPPEISQLSFFYTNFANSEEAANYVIKNNKGPGTFLLRPSTRNPGALTLTISIDHTIARHVNVQVQADERSSSKAVSYFIIPERAFASFQALYCYYSLNTICNREMVSNVRLLSPLEKAPVLQGPLVMPDEIPPLPRRSSVNSRKGSISMQSDPATEDGRRMSNTSQSGLAELPPMSAFPEIPSASRFPEIPPISTRPDRPSLDSQGNERQLGSSSNSSESGAGPGRQIGACVNGQASQYIAPEFSGPNPLKTRTFVPPQQQSVAPPLPSSPQFVATSPPKAATLSKKQLKEEQKREKEKKKKSKDKDKKKQAAAAATEVSHMGELGWCRPPMPIPASQGPQEEETPYYTSPRAYKNHLEELKKMLRESEICDCGLRMMDAELVQGWTVHRSREPDTFKRVFYQHENGNTTWGFPEAITEELSEVQVLFIARLCKEGGQELPVSVVRRCQRLTLGGSFPSTSSLGSSRSRSGSNTSDQLMFSRSPPFDQRQFPGSGGVGK